MRDCPPEILDRAYRRLDELACCTEAEGEITRTFASDAMLRAATLVEGWLRAAGLAVERDGWLNVTGRTPGGKSRVLVLGSHYDTVRLAGAYDGALGISAALCALECLGPQTLGSLPFDIEVAAFSEEEGVRFATTYLGSRATWGKITDGDLEAADALGIRLREVIEPSSWQPPARYSRETVAAFVEAHIEQGPVLESRGEPLGVVTAIAGQSRVQISLEGAAAHAGTCPMTLRRDALAGAAEWICAVEKIAAHEPELVATVGTLAIPHAASNVVPGRVRMSLDVRHARDEIRRAAAQAMEQSLGEIARRRNLAATWECVLEQAATPMDARVAGLLARACGGAADCPRLVSGAGHDAVIFASEVPTGMIFVRCREGRSHHPEEFASAEDFAAVVRALADFILLFAEGTE